MNRFTRHRCSVFAAAVCVFLGTAGTLPAQNAATATVTGTVLDPLGKSLPDATVAVKNQATGHTGTANTGSDGRFSIGDLSTTGAYTVDVSASGFATNTRTGLQLLSGGTDISITLSVENLVQSVTVEGNTSVAAQLAPSQSSLEARSAISEISSGFIQNFTAPTADYTEVLMMAPGTFSVNPNGVGLGDAKIFFRGFSDGKYTMTFDGIPFEDTNDPTHHSWGFFPAQFIGTTDFDRSPGSASTIGPTNFGGSINMLSRDVPSTFDIRGTVSYGSWDTILLGLDFDSGSFGPGGKSSLFANVHQMRSEGYQTYNTQKRDGGSLKYQYKLSDATTISVFGEIVDLWTHTPNVKGPTRAQVAEFGDNYLLSGDPTNPLYYVFDFYHVATQFTYLGITSDLGSGWRLDTKPYFYRYWNKQNYNGSSISATSATDKLNGYSKAGDVLTLSQVSRWGIFRTGAWYEWAYTDRYQIPSGSAHLEGTSRSAISTSISSHSRCSPLSSMSCT